LSAAFLALLLGCQPDGECFTPRTGDETSCEVQSKMSTWALTRGQPIEDSERFCKASCIDAEIVGISGYTDLREVPLLAKMRSVHYLTVVVDGVKDLRGLENVDVDVLHLTTSLEDPRSFKSFDGLGDRELDELDLSKMFGLLEFDGSRFDKLGSFAASDSGLQRIDLSMHSGTNVGLNRLDDVTSVALGGASTWGVSFVSLGSLRTFTWQPDLRVTKTINIQNNPVLSSCVVADLVAQTRPQLVLTSNNGPCP
jgi:hypothetical protein